jgi:hypothetical protein
MHLSCWFASVNLYLPVEQTPLLYKEVSEFLRRPWRHQPADSAELFHLGLGELTWNLPAGEWGFSW